MRLLARTNSSAPISASSCWMRVVTPDGARPSLAAAWVTLSSLATAQKIVRDSMSIAFSFEELLCYYILKIRIYCSILNLMKDTS